MSWCGFIWIYLCGFILFEVCLPPWFCEFVPVAKFEEVFRHYFKFFFSLTLFLLSWNSDGRNVRSFVIVPWVPETVFIFCFSLFSLCCSYWIISILSLSLLILSSLSSFLLLRPSIILISVIIFFSPKISFWFFIFYLYMKLYVSLLRLFVFSSAPSMFIIDQWNIFTMAALKILFRSFWHLCNHDLGIFIF